MAEVVYKAQFDINVNKTGGGAGKDKEDKKETALSKIKSSFNLSSNKLMTGTAGAVAGALTVYAIKKISNTLISNIGLSAGDSYMQEKVQFGLEIASSFINNVIGGGMAGSVIPGVGTIAGGLAGLTTWLFTTGAEWASASYTAGLQKSIDKLNIGQIRLISGLGSSSFGRYSGSGELY